MAAVTGMWILFGVEPPAPPVPQPGSIGQPPPVAPQPQPRRGFPWLWVILGCGCLLALIIVGGIVAGLWFAGSHVQKEVEEIQREQKLPPMPQPPSTIEEGNPGGASSSGNEADAKPSPGAKPSEAVARARALLATEEGWVARVTKHSGDWSTATVAIGPPNSEWVGEIDLKWEDGEYIIVEKRAVEQP